jgi:hypothetical protein
MVRPQRAHGLLGNAFLLPRYSVSRVMGVGCVRDDAAQAVACG